MSLRDITPGCQSFLHRYIHHTRDILRQRELQQTFIVPSNTTAVISSQHHGVGRRLPQIYPALLFLSDDVGHGKNLHMKTQIMEGSRPEDKICNTIINTKTLSTYNVQYMHKCG